NKSACGLWPRSASALPQPRLDAESASLSIGLLPAELVEVVVQPLQPEREPATAGLQEADLQAGEALHHAAGDHAHDRQHLLQRVVDRVALEDRLEAVDADGQPA